jgi:hypothetical protein
MRTVDWQPKYKLELHTVHSFYAACGGDACPQCNSENRVCLSPLRHCKQLRLIPLQYIKRDTFSTYLHINKMEANLFAH